MASENENFSSGLAPDDSAYNEALGWLYSQLPMFSRVGAAAYKPGLQTSEALDKAFGQPHRRFRSIHIGGTNGKGSTSHILAAILQAAGYKVGLYTSPHLVDFRERIRVNGRMIPRAEVTDFVTRWKSTPFDGHPSFFELTMMMAFDHFASEQVDFGVIEVGMGGRLDSTNIISPIATVITNISKDHTQFLGSTLPEIAREKAGIMKAGVPVVIGEAEGDVREVFTDKGAEVGTAPVFASENPLTSDFEPIPEGGWKFDTEDYGPLTSPLGGVYQRQNINTVLHAVRMLRRAGVKIPDEAVRQGMAEVIRLTGLAGRWMHLVEHPLVIADTGHNIDGLSGNMSQLMSLLGERRKETPGASLRMVIGFVADKAIDDILRLLPEDAEYYVTQAAIPRALAADALAEKFAALGLRHHTVTPAPEAYHLALEASRPQDILYVGGSTFVVADVLASLQQSR
ncbi:MAG: bifunctional folylpolyglutamate synthase/dihydrofolate synthase [Muribaculaceae bacterium]|nr:bifunctional folylpolyglutamate synthase/dihydrofolate synthase [Muribaculaceae bacterium]